MKRRAFIAGVASAVALPAVARAQAMPVVGVLHSASPEPYAKRMAGFHKGLSDGGFVPGRNIAIEYRWAGGNYARLTEMAQDLASRNVAVIFAAGGVASAPAAKKVTSTIPVVFAIGSDPVADGLVQSLGRPGGNMTGISFLTQTLGAKRLGFLNVIAPSAADIAVVVNPNNPAIKASIDEFEAAARVSKKNIHFFEARTAGEIDSAFAAINTHKSTALVVHSDPFFTSRLAQMAALGTKTGRPAIYSSRDYTEAGGLMSYGADIRDEYRKAGEYVARILHGAKPADMPIAQPTRFELILNLKTAKAIGLAIPDAFQLLADEVIE